MGNRDPAPALKAEAALIPTRNQPPEQTRITSMATTTTAKLCNPKNPNGKSNGNSPGANGIGRAEGQGGGADGAGGAGGAEGKEGAEVEEAAAEEGAAAGEEGEAEEAEGPHEEPPERNAPGSPTMSLKTSLGDSLGRTCSEGDSAALLGSKPGTRAGELSCTTTTPTMTILCTPRIL